MNKQVCKEHSKKSASDSRFSHPSWIFLLISYMGKPPSQHSPPF
jgi:hypothetical protein